jgi:hypothetical protein
MSGRLRVLLIVALLVLPVTADLRDGLIWSQASAQKDTSAAFLPGSYLLNIFPWCTYGKYISYSVSGQIIGSHPWFLVYGTNGQWNCRRAICRRSDWCISEVKVGSPLPYGPYPVPSKITWGCVEALCITVRAVRPIPYQ